MKIAKKMLAVVMAVAMVACFAAVVFAAPSGAKVTFNVGKYDADKGRAKVTVVLTDCVGLTAGSIDFKYDTSVVTKASKVDGSDAKLTGDLDNAFANDFNPDNGEAGFYFKNNLYSTEKWNEVADDLEVDAKVNGEAFEALVFTFTAPEGTEIPVSYTLKFGEEVVNGSATITLGEKKVDETTAKPVDETTAKPVDETTAKPADETTAKPADETTAKPADETTASKETTTAKEPPKTDGGVSTGDNGVLAVVAGVVALAGAAFVVTKKRK